jgi:hypothetical protein
MKTGNRNRSEFMACLRLEQKSRKAYHAISFKHGSLGREQKTDKRHEFVPRGVYILAVYG